MPQAIILFGPPGAGKGTQAEKLKDAFGLHHLETAKIIEQALNSHTDDEVLEIDGISYLISEERRKFTSGELNTPKVVLYLICETVKSLHQNGESIVFSGSPRTVEEAEILTPLLTSLYTPKMVRVVYLNISPKISLIRNTQRVICSVCRLPHRQEEAMVCKRCNGELISRGTLDSRQALKIRLQEFTQRTLPALVVMERFGVSVTIVDGEREEEEIFKDLMQILQLDHP